MSRVAYFYREMSEYIEIDLRLLRERHEVEVTGCPSRWPQPLRTWRSVSRADAVLTWFASWHALLPALCARLQGKPFAVIVGGYDTACLPGIDYGHQRGGLRRWVARAVMALATRVVAISPFTVREARALGVPAGRLDLLPLALDPLRYACAAVRGSGLVITTGGVHRGNLARKGLESFVRAAALLPDATFVVIGAWMDDAIGMLRAMAAPNVEFAGRLEHADKAAWMSRAAVVVQASRHEAFGLSLAEGMLSGAVPVVTDAGALPWVAGGAGVVAGSQAPVDLALAIRRALELGAPAGRRARERILAAFTLERRRAGLEALLRGRPVPAWAEDVLGPGTADIRPGGAPAGPERIAA